jgi:hypothetical protein
MPRLEPIGRVPDPSLLNDEPLIVPIVGYVEKTKEEVITEIRFVANVPIGAALDMIRATDANGNINPVAALDYIDKCVHPDDRASWETLLHDPKIIVQQSTLLAVYAAIGEFYAGRPLLQRSGSRDGRSSTKKTSQVAASSRKRS